MCQPISRRAARSGGPADGVPRAPGGIRIADQKTIHWTTEQEEAVESRLEQLADELESLTVEDWARMCQILFREFYGSSGASRRSSKAVPGSRQKLMALVRRYALRQDLWHKDDLSCDEKGTL
jgi:hypothetical protein